MEETSRDIEAESWGGVCGRKDNKARNDEDPHDLSISKLKKGRQEV